ncbi:MAG: amidohydrolase family protein [Oscillospiraceae bacterium]
MPDRDYELGGLPIKLGGGVAACWTAPSGSCINVGEALRRAVSFGVPLEAAVTAATITPARSVRLDDCGELAPGKRADIVVLDTELKVKAVFVGGEKVVG